MIRLKKIIITSLLSFLCIQVYCQKKLQSTLPIVIKSTIIDTVETTLNSTLVNILWLNDTIRVRVQNKDLKIDPNLIRALQRSDSMAVTEKDIDRILLGLKTGGQNCYSYALQNYFDNSKTFSQDVFGKSTEIDQKSAKKILDNYFKEIVEFSVSPTRNLKQAIPNNTLLAFMNKHDWAIHFVYYRDNIFYSKNGGLKPMEFQSLRKFLKKSYQDTHKIIVYKIDENKVKSNWDNI